MTLREFLDRYGATAAVITAMTVLVLLLPGNASDRDTGVSAGSGALDGQVMQPGETDAAASGEGVVPGAVDGTTVDSGSGALPGPVGGSGGAIASGGGRRGTTTGGTAGATGTPSIALGQGPCRADKRELGIALYMPPCLTFTGSNGGVTGRGVTPDKVVITRFVSQSDPATVAILKGYKLADDPPVVTRAFQALFRYSNLHYETYGREVVYTEYNASGPDENDEAMKADAVKIARDVKPFAVIGGPKVLGQELAQRGVICICTVSLSSDFYNSNPPYIFGSLPTADEYSIHTAEYIGKRLAGKNAKWAGDNLNPTQGYRGKKREFGLILLEGANGRVDPEGKKIRDVFVAELAKYGVKLKAEYRFLYDPGRNQQDVTNMIATMKNAGVTSVIGMWDPLSPIFITKEATRQQWFPEWVMTGTGLSDTTTAGRLYDQQQWNRAFGVSPLWVTWNALEKSEGYREFHHGMPGMAKGDEGFLINIYRAPVQQIFVGIHMAGPKLTSDTFTQGMYNYPPTGGTPWAPLWQITRKYPTSIKDFVEVFYKQDERGKDERDDDGLGMVMKVNGGKRYRAGQWPDGEPRVFDPEGAIAVGDAPLGQGPFPHEQDGHKHTGKCLSC